MIEISLSTIGADRPGIVAAITGVLAKLGCSIEDSEMAVLRGHFAVMLVLAAPDELTPDEIVSSMSEVIESFDLVVSARALGRGTPAAQTPGATLSVSVHGADRPGIVHGVTEVLAEARANVVSLRTHVAGDQDNPLYAMILEAHLPSDIDLVDVEARLGEIASRLGVAVSVSSVDDELL